VTLLADAVVIGGGPAGAAAARLLASWGQSVVVLARAARQPPLAESLPPSSVKLFDEIGVRAAVDRAGFIRATGNTVQWGRGEADCERRVEMFGRAGLGYQVSRDKFDELLLDGAQAAGASVERDVSVRGAELEGDLWRVQVDRGGGGNADEVRARWILDCSGRAGVIARRGWRRADSVARTIAVAGVWERVGAWPLDDDTHTFVESYANGWAWSIPMSATRRFVTVMLDPRVTTVPGRAELEAAYHAQLALAPGLRALVDGATLVAAPWACDATPYSSTQVAGEGVLLVGDAASFVDPLSSFGVKKALASAWLAAVAVHSALIDSSTTGPALELFTGRELAMTEHLRQGAAALARDAAGAHETRFWSARADVDPARTSDEWDVDALRADGRVHAAFEELKRRSALQLRAAESLRFVSRPVVRGHRIGLEEHLAAPVAPNGVRYCRNIDLVVLARLAPRFDQVPDLYEAYNRAAPPAPLPDFLGALSTLVGFEMLTLG
jgi:flavin-dependent dehydrogenase